MVEHKVIKVQLGTWRKLRGLVRGKKDETFTDYIQRVTEVLNENNKNKQVK